MHVPPPRILLVEDDATTRAFLAAAAAALPAQVHVAASLAQARALLQAAAYDLLLIDAHLPDGSGAALLREVRRRADTPALAHTAGIDRGGHDALVDAGFTEVLRKPLTGGQLLQAMRRALAIPGPGVADRVPAQRRDATPVWDTEVALAVVDHRVDQMEQLRALFVADLPALRDAIVDASAAGDAVALQDQLHRLLGGCGFVAATRLALGVRALREAPDSDLAMREFVEAVAATLATVAAPSA